MSDNPRHPELSIRALPDEPIEAHHVLRPAAWPEHFEFGEQQ